MTNQSEEQGRRQLSRRDLLKRGAVVGAATAWTVPLVQVISMTPAHAETPSAPHVPPATQPPPATEPPATEPPTSKSRTTTAPPPSSKSRTTQAVPTDPGNSSGVDHAVAVAGGGSNLGSGGLAATGLDAPLVPTIAVGVGAVALGAGALAASRAVREWSEGDRPRHSGSAT